VRATVPNPAIRNGRLSVNVTDRALRYRATVNPPPGPRRCHYCGARGRVDVEHVDGREENGGPENLGYACRSCNTRKGVVFRNAGIGRRTRQFNPKAGRKRGNPGGAQNLAQWLNAVMALKGQGGTISLPAAVAMVQETPHSKRSEFARESWDRRRAHGTDRREEVPF
jgi:hypothetical protein